MGIREDLLAENAAHDPYGFKAKGENGIKSLHVNEPYVYQEFPQIVYKDGAVLTVNDQDALDKALTDGYGKEPVADASVVTGAPIVEPVHVVIDEPVTEKPVVIATAKSSGIDGDAGDWTAAGDGTQYPGDQTEILPVADENAPQV